MTTEDIEVNKRIIRKVERFFKIRAAYFEAAKLPVPMWIREIICACTFAEAFNELSPEREPMFTPRFVMSQLITRCKARGYTAQLLKWQLPIHGYGIHVHGIEIEFEHWLN